MKERLIDLIDKTEEIEKRFHYLTGIYSCMDMISDVPEFLEWKEDLLSEFRNIYDSYSNESIKEIIKILSGPFNSYHEHNDFNILKAKLKNVRKNIDQYFPMGSTQSHVEEIMQKQPKIFISHSSKDKEQVELFVDLLLNVGLREDQIFCSSVPGCGIELGKQIFDELLSQFESFDLHVIMILSKNYYESPVCLNEMGAAWVLGVKSDFILLPEFDFSDVKGVVEKNNIGISLGKDLREAKHRLNQLQNNLAGEFHFKKITEIRWEEKRDAFLNAINELKGEE